MAEAYRSMMDITGATSTAAEAALIASVPSRQPRFLVFHCLSDLLSTDAFGDAIARSLASGEEVGGGKSELLPHP